ncbi:MAG: N-acetyltransferase, partial [bacterium]|nr:N-acetyltransferase [bacterium]
MLPRTMPVLSDGRVTLRALRDSDVEVVRSAAHDPLIPLITTVPASGATEEALAYIARQHDRLR